MRHQSLCPATNTMTKYSVMLCFRRLRQVKVKNVRDNFNKLLFVNRYDGNVNLTHGLGGPTRMSAPRGPHKLNTALKLRGAQCQCQL